MWPPRKQGGSSDAPCEQLTSPGRNAMQELCSICSQLQRSQLQNGRPWLLRCLWCADSVAQHDPCVAGLQQSLARPPREALTKASIAVPGTLISTHQHWRHHTWRARIVVKIFSSLIGASGNQADDQAQVAQLRRRHPAADRQALASSDVASAVSALSGESVADTEQAQRFPPGSTVSSHAERA